MMAESRPLREPWLLAAWPGLGNVAINAAAYLINALGGMEPVGEIPGRQYFDVQHIEVQRGIARVPGLPRSRMFQWRNPDGGPGGTGRDLLVFLGEAQPPSGGHALCRELIDQAVRRGVTRVVTIAALATQLHPEASPQVRAAVTDASLLPELRERSLPPLEEGQIGGLNGVALAAALERKIPGVCITAEIPFFAAGVPNLKASKAALEAFSKLSGVKMDLAPLNEQAEVVTKKIVQMLEHMRRASAGEEPESEFGVSEQAAAEGPDKAKPAESEPRPLSLEARERIERLFEDARQDKGRAFALKEELDRLGAFEQYEDRFLDLFRRAE
jgi:predicted ATP-grasp superfamily ATP-dependent carboligase